MAGDESAGSLSQDDINAALAEAELESDGGTGASDTPVDSPSSADAPAGLGQADTDVAPADKGSSQAKETAALDAPSSAQDAQRGPADPPFDEVAALMTDAVESEAADDAAPASGEQAVSERPRAEAAAFEPPRIENAPTDNTAQTQGIDLLRDVQLNVKIELGRSRMLVDDVLKLGPGCVVELDKLAGDPVDVFVNDRLAARGEVLVLNDNFCVRINDIVQQEPEGGGE